MMHESTAMIERECELINIVPFNPLISKCQVKVCYVGEQPNRNRSIITKEVARDMANSLPGCPIVGYYNAEKKDFEEHNRIIDLSNGKFEIKDTTRPYGFIDLNPHCWFQWFLDDDQVEREYLVVEGWLWTAQYPECERAITHGNNQSMELAENWLEASWAKEMNGKGKFFIINKAIIEKLCILGENVEPCFEGASITKSKFSLETEFKNQLQTMLFQLENLKKGGTQVFTVFNVSVGDTVWNGICQYLKNNCLNDEGEVIYDINGFYTDVDNNNYALLKKIDSDSYAKLEFSLENDEVVVNGISFYSFEENEEIPSCQFTEEELLSYKKKDDKEKKEDAEDSEEKKEESEESEQKSDREKPADSEQKPEEKETKEEDEKKKKKYNLEEIPEYVALCKEQLRLQAENDRLNQTLNSLRQANEELTSFKLAAERKDKEAMINNFYMLSDEDKAEVRNNIDKYSLEDIESKLAVICFRNKVSFDDVTEENIEGAMEAPVTYNLESQNLEEEVVSPWIKALINVKKEIEK